MNFKQLAKAVGERHPDLLEVIGTKLPLLPISSQKKEQVRMQILRNRRLQGNYQGAQEILDSLPTGDGLLLATRLDNQGRIYHDTSKWDEAQRAYEQGLEMISPSLPLYMLEECLEQEVQVGIRGLRAVQRHASLQNNLAHLLTVRDDGEHDYERAQKLLDESMITYEQENRKDGVAYALIHRAELERACNDLEKSYQSATRALELEQEIGNASGEALARHQLALTLVEQGQMQEATDQFESALLLVQGTKLYKRIEADIKSDFSKILRYSNDQRASRLSKQAVSFYEASGI